MQNREFENKVQGKMDGLKLTPSDAVWDKVEASLPKEKKRRWVIFILLFAILMTGGLFVWNGFNKNEVNNTAQRTTPKNETGKENISSGKTMQNEKTADTITGLASTKDDNTITSSLYKNKKDILSAVTRVKIKKPVQGSWIDSKEELVNAHPKKIITKGDTKIKVRKPSEISDSETIIAAAGDITKITEGEIVPGVVVNDSVNNIPATKLADSLTTVKKDTATTVTKENKKIKKADRWHYGIELAGGTSNVKSNLFSGSAVYANPLSNAVGSPGTPVIPIPNKPSQNIAIAITLYAEKNISAKWKFKTGLNYSYQSNTIQTGNKVDSVGSFTFTAYSSIATPRYYRAGKTNNYTNQFHLMGIPLLFQFNYSKKIPVYFEAGPTIGYLLFSNALIYNSSTASYFTSGAIFNKLLLSIQMGAGIDIGKKTKIPFSIGYQFKYSTSSVIKPAFAEQHFINSLFYLKIPLKK